MTSDIHTRKFKLQASACHSKACPEVAAVAALWNDKPGCNDGTAWNFNSKISKLRQRGWIWTSTSTNWSTTVRPSHSESLVTGKQVNPLGCPVCNCLRFRRHSKRVSDFYIRFTSYLLLWGIALIDLIAGDVYFHAKKKREVAVLPSFNGLGSVAHKASSQKARICLETI